MDSDQIKFQRKLVNYLTFDKFSLRRGIEIIGNMTTTSYYTFYRAGILSGVDAKGTFLPSDNIKRSEVAAILIRMMDQGSRVSAPKELGK